VKKGTVVVPNALTEQDQREDAKWTYEQIRSAAEKIDEAAIKSAENVVRTLLLINGGAAVSFLAFIGGLASKDRLPATQLYSIAGSLIPFAFGVACAALCGCLAYLTHFSHTKILYTVLESWPNVHETVRTKCWQRVRRVFHFLAAVAALASLGLFVYGMFDVRSAISHLG
jgi:hypothetical protein